MNIMTKFGEKVNRATYQHICDTTSDLEKIPKEQINFGSLVYVISTGELYITDSDLNWVVV